MSTIFYTVLLSEPHFPVRFISAGKLGTFRGPFNDPGEASQEFQCCYAEGATEYVNPDDFAARAAGLPEFLTSTGSAPAEQAAKAPAYCTDREPVCEIGVTIQREASRIYSLYLDAILQHLDAEVIAERKASWERAGDFYDTHLQECRPPVDPNHGLPKLTPEEIAHFQAYFAEVEAEDARLLAEGKPVFNAIFNELRADDGDDFDSGAGDAYLSFYDRRPPKPEMTCQGLYEFLMAAGETGQSARYRAGFIFGWGVAFGEREPSFYWKSAPPPCTCQVCGKRFDDRDKGSYQNMDQSERYCPTCNPFAGSPAESEAK